METNQLTPPANAEAPMTGMAAMPDPAQAAAEPPKKKPWIKVLVGALVLVLLGGAMGYYYLQNPDLFKAEITEVGAPAPGPQGPTMLYIPVYNAGPTDSGAIAVKVKKEAVPEGVHSIQFKLKWSPVTAMSLNDKSIIFDSGTLFRSSELKSVNVSTPGEAVISFFSDTPVNVPSAAGLSADETVFKLNVKLNGVQNQAIDLTAEAVEVISATAGPIPFDISTRYTAMDAGEINLVGQNELRVLYAEAQSETRVVVKFSDLLKNVGAVGNYFLGGCAAGTLPQSIASGFMEGLTQDTVILNFAEGDINPGEKQVLCVNGGAMGNTKGGIATAYRNALFFGFYSGYGDEMPSSVGTNAIQVEDSTTLALAFSGELTEATVTPVNVIVEYVNDTGALNELTVESAEIAGSGVRLKTAQQTSDRQYFVWFNGVKDSIGNTLANHRILSFFGHTVPPMTVATVRPATLANDQEQLLIVTGTNLDTVVTARVGTTEVVVRDAVYGVLNLLLPAGFATGEYPLILVNSAGDTHTTESAVVVTQPDRPMRIISEDSRAIPNRVPPDGTTPVTFWVLVEDPVDLNSIDSVTIDLEQIGGNRAQEMEKDTGLQRQYRQFYKFRTAVTTDTPTQDTPYTLPVQVRKGGTVAEGTVSIEVTRDVLRSVAPEITQAFVTPSTVEPDGETEVKLSLKINDPDGADTITSVVAEGGTGLGIGFIPLRKIEIGGAASEAVTAWFESDTFVVPDTVKDGTYAITITAEDATGESVSTEVNLTVSAALNAPSIESSRSYIGPRNTVQKDGKSSFSVFAMVRDPDGVSDIVSVMAYAKTLGINPFPLKKDPNVTGDKIEVAMFSSEAVTVPASVPFGIHEIEVVATDSGGQTATLILQLDVTFKDTFGDSPNIINSKNYSTPRAAVNDGQTRVTLYAFVRDDDDDIKSVVANLSGIGQVGAEPTPELGQAAAPAAPSGDGGCPTGSATYACMTPGFKEGLDGQWFVLQDVTVSRSTVASGAPYEIPVVATDETGKVSRGVIKLAVRDNDSFVNDGDPPKMVLAVATSATSVEILFNEPMESTSIKGSNFRIFDENDISKTLTVSKATVNAAGTLVTLTTEGQTAGKSYGVSADKSVTDSVGIPVATGRGGQAIFKGFEESDAQPAVEYIAATGSETIEIEFREPLRPSSVKLAEATDKTTRSGLNFEIVESGSNTPLPIYGVRFLDGATTIELATARQRSGQHYRVRIAEIRSAAGVKPRVALNKLVKGFKAAAVQREALGNQADLNGDGQVDFMDFTMFSAVYGQAFGLQPVAPGSSADPAEGTSQGLSPIGATPDSTVPHTSQPAGGAVGN